MGVDIIDVGMELFSWGMGYVDLFIIYVMLKDVGFSLLEINIDVYMVV